MNIRDLLYQIFLKVKRNKSFVFFFFIMIICTILTLSTLALFSNFNTYIDNLTNKNIGFRILDVSASKRLNMEISKEILNVNHVLDVYSSEHDLIGVVSPNFKTKETGGLIYLTYGSSKFLPNIIVGRKISENEKNVAICPIDFLPDAVASEFIKINDKYIINGANLLNKKFIVEYYSNTITETKLIPDEKYEKEFEIVGLYDSKAIMNFNNQCYITPSDIIEIINTTIPKNINEYISSYYVLVDDVKHIDIVKTDLLKLGYDDVIIKNSFNSNLINIIFISCTVVMTISLFAVVIFTVSYTKKKLIEETNIIGVFRASGFDKKSIRKLYVLEIAISNIIAYIIGLLLFLLIYIILKNTIFHSLFYSGIRLYINSYIYIICFVIIVIIPFCISIFFLLKLINSNIILLLKGRE